MSISQSGILPPIPPLSRYLEFRALPDQDIMQSLRDISKFSGQQNLVVGFGHGLVLSTGNTIAGLKSFPNLSGPGCEIPSTQADIWCWIRGDDNGQILHTAREFTALIAPAFRRVRQVDGFRYKSGLDLTGYEDGTENPTENAAITAAFVHGAGSGMDGSSFVAVQQWVHDLDYFQSLDGADKDNIIGRRLKDNYEFEDAPLSAHVKRTAQESFEPEAFVLRRSMPWADATGEGLQFVAFGHSVDAFEAQLKRMAGLEDGILDGLFRFSHPVTGGYYWCPPCRDGHLDLSALGR